MARSRVIAEHERFSLADDVPLTHCWCTDRMAHDDARCGRLFQLAEGRTLFAAGYILGDPKTASTQRTLNVTLCTDFKLYLLVVDLKMIINSTKV